MADDTGFDLNTAQDVGPADDGGFDVSTAQDVNAPTQTAAHEESGKVVQMPAGLDGHEADYLAKTQVQGRNPADFYGVLDMGEGFAKKLGHIAYQATTPVSWEFDKQNTLRDVVNNTPELLRGAANFAATAIPSMIGSNMQEGGEREAQRQPEVNKQVLGVVDSLPLPESVKGFFHEAYGQQGQELTDAVAQFSTDSGKMLRERNAQWATDHGLDRPKDGTAGVMYDLGSGAASTGTSLALAMLARNPEAAAILFGGMQKADTYQEARAAGKDPESAGKISSVNGLVNGVLEGVGNKIFADVAHADTSPFRKLIASALEEGGQEGAQQIADEGITAASGVRQSDMQTKLANVAYATAIGAVAGAGASGVEQIGSKVAEQHGLDPEVGVRVAGSMMARKDELGAALQQTINQGVAGVSADPKSAAEVAKIVKDFQTGVDIPVPDTVRQDITPQATALEQSLKAQLTAAGQGEEEAATNAGLTRAAYESLSKRYPGLQDQIDTAFKGLSVGNSEAAGTFNQNPIEDALAQTPEFKNWFGESKVLTPEGQPLRVFHGTTVDFEAFDRSKANVESDVGAGFYFTNEPEDVGANYAGEGPDLTQKIQLTAERIASETDREYDDPDVVAEARAQFVQHGGAAIPVYLSIKNPVKLGGNDETRFEMSEEVDDDGEPVGEPTGSLVAILDAVDSVASDFGADAAQIKADIMDNFDGESVSAGAVFKAIKEGEGGVYAEHPETGQMASGELFRQVLEYAGYDGIIDSSVDEKFGSQRTKGKSMEGMNESTVHYIAFRPEQIKSAVGNKGTFDPNDPRILYQGGREPLESLNQVANFANEQGVDLGMTQQKDGTLDLYRIIAAEEGKGSGTAVMQAITDFADSKGVKVVLTPDDSYGATSIKRLKEFYKRFGFVENKGKNRDFSTQADMVRLPQKVLNQGGKRGSIKLGNGMAAINLFKAADASTFLHETGHFYWNTLDKLAEAPGAPAQLKTDVATIRAFVGANPGEALTTAQEELRTRAVEAYLMEGRAPSARLAQVFERFRKWLQDVYKTVKALKVDITPEVRGVLDRIFATDDEMVAARHRALDLEKVGRVRYLDKQVAALDEQIDALDQLMMDRDKDGKPNVANQKALDKLLAQRDGLDEERAQILTGEGEKQAMEFDSRPIELRAGDVQKLVGDERRRALEQGLREGRKMARENLKEAQTFLLNVINESGLQAADKAKFLATLKNIQTTEQLDKVLGVVQSRIGHLLEAQARRELKAKILKLLDKAKARKSGGKPQGRFTPEVQDTLDQLRAASKLTVGEAETRLAANLANEDPTPEMAMENRVLQALIGSPSGELQMTLQGIQDLLAEGKAGAVDRMMERAERIANLRMYTLTAVSSGEDRSLVDRTSLNERLGQIIRDVRGELYRGQNSFTDLMNLITGADKTGAKDAVLENLGYQISDGWRVREGIARRATERVASDVMKAFGFTRTGQATAQLERDAKLVHLGQFTNAAGTPVLLQMSKAQARKRWMEMQDPTLLETITHPNGNAYTPAMMDAIEQFLTPADKEFARAQMAFYQDFYEQVNAVYSQVYGVNLPSNPNYSPISRRHKKEAEVDTFNGELGFRRSAAPGGLKSRVASRSSLKDMNDFSVIQRHIGEMAHFIAMQNKVQELSSVFNNNDIRDAIVDRYGKVVMSTIDDYLQDFARGQIKVIRDGLSWFETMRQNFSASVLGAKPALALKQMTAFVAYGENIPTADFTKGFAEMLANPLKAARVLNDSELMKSRNFNLERDIMLAEKAAQMGNFRLVKKFRNAMYWFVQAGDRASLVMGGYPVYLYHKNVLKQTHEQALNAFDRATARAQQMSDLDQLSRLQASGSVGSRLLTMFGSGQNQFYRRETQAFLDYARGTIGTGDFTKRVLVYHFIAPMLFQFVADFFRFDPANQARAAIFGSLNGFFIGYQLLDTLMRKLLGQDTFGGGGVASSVGQFASKILDGVTKLTDEDADSDEVATALNKIASGLGEALGLPLGRLTDVMQAFEDFGNGDTGSGSALLGGWPRSVAKNIRAEGEDF